MQQPTKRSVGRPRKNLAAAVLYTAHTPVLPVILADVPQGDGATARALRVFANDLEEIMGDSRDFFTLRAAITSLMNDRGLYTKPVTTTND